MKAIALLAAALTLVSCGPRLIVCPDGETVSVLRSVEDVFPAYTKEYEANFTAASSQLNSFASDAAISAQGKAKTVKLRQDLDQERAALQERLKTITISLQTSPCDKEVRKRVLDLQGEVKAQAGEIPNRAKEARNFRIQGMKNSPGAVQAESITINQFSESPRTEQHSSGANSPNIVGNQNLVVINPDNPAKLDEIRDLLRGIGSSDDPRRLLKKYPLGYVIFELDYKNEVFPHKSKSIFSKFELDWSAVGYTKNTADRVEIRLPDLKLKNGKGGLTNVLTGGRKKVGDLGGAILDNLAVWGEILAIRENGIVFLVGFEENNLRP